MFRNTRVQMALVLAVGVLGGFAFASGTLNFFAQSQASPPGVASTESKEKGDGPGCCTDGVTEEQQRVLVAHNQAVAAPAAQAGKKPNILVI